MTPSSGSATIEIEASSIEVGLDWNPLVETMPLNTDPGNGDNLMRKRRVVSVSMSVFETLGLRLNGVAVPDRRFDIDSFDEPPTPVTGVVHLEATSNWDRDLKTITIDQVDPMPFHLLALDVAVESS